MIGLSFSWKIDLRDGPLTCKKVPWKSPLKAQDTLFHHFKAVFKFPKSIAISSLTCESDPSAFSA